MSIIGQFEVVGIEVMSGKIETYVAEPAFLLISQIGSLYHNRKDFKMRKIILNTNLKYNVLYCRKCKVSGLHM